VKCHAAAWEPWGLCVAAPDVVLDGSRSLACRHLQKVNKLNETLKGQLHNVTTGLETVIQTARAHQKIHEHPNGHGNDAPPNGAYHPPSAAQGMAVTAAARWPQEQQYEEQQWQHEHQQQQEHKEQQWEPNGAQAPVLEGRSAAADPTASGDGAHHTSTVSCVVQHPGALCCTKTTASANPASMTCTVTLETTAR
jgi:hypothetical protein